MQEKQTSLKKNLLVVGVILMIVAALLILSRLNMNSELPAPLPSASPAQTDAPDGSAAAAARAYLLISVGGRLYGIEPLDEERDVEIAQPTGETNVIHITRDGFHMKSSTCDNQLCISQGEVTVENYARRILGPYVLCLPNQVELQLYVPGATAAPDTPDI